MALKATIYKAHLQIADMDRQVYGEHPLTLALHPSETEERLLVRLLALDRKSTRLNSSHLRLSRMPSSA